MLTLLLWKKVSSAVVFLLIPFTFHCIRRRHLVSVGVDTWPTKCYRSKKKKVLGVTLDTHLTFTQHSNNIAVKVQQRNYVSKALAGSTWGCDTETLLATYQAIGRSILSYCCPVWTPSLKDTNWSRLQQAQNTALRIATGCLKMADVTEVHHESRELPVRQHDELVSQQLAIACYLPQHPCHQLFH